MRRSSSQEDPGKRVPSRRILKKEGAWNVP